MFIEMNSPEDAALAIRVMDGYAFDKKHRFAVNRFTDVEKLANLSEEYQEPAEEEYKARVSKVSHAASGIPRSEVHMGHSMRPSYSGTSALLALRPSRSRPARHLPW